MKACSPGWLTHLHDNHPEGSKPFLHSVRQGHTRHTTRLAGESPVDAGQSPVDAGPGTRTAAGGRVRGPPPDGEGGRDRDQVLPSPEPRRGCRHSLVRPQGCTGEKEEKQPVRAPASNRAAWRETVSSRGCGRSYTTQPKQAKGQFCVGTAVGRPSSFPKPSPYCAACVLNCLSNGLSTIKAKADFFPLVPKIWHRQV